METDELDAAASHVRLSTGQSYSESLRQVEFVRDHYGITPESYVQNGLYRLPPSDLDLLRNRDEYVAAVAGAKGLSYEHAFATMQDLRRRFGIEYREFIRLEFHRCDSEEQLRSAVLQYLDREAMRIRQVSFEVGWDIDEAESRMRSTKCEWPTIDFQKFAVQGYFSKGPEEVAVDVNFISEIQQENREKVSRESGWSDRRVREHMAYVQTAYGIGPAYYMCYRAWNLSESQLTRFLTQRHSNALIRKYNDRASARTVARKDEFFKKYGEFTKRRFWLNRDTSFDEFLSFAEGLDSVFCKPLRARHGAGAFIVDLPRAREGLRSVYDDLTSQNRLIVEESIQQHALVRNFYPRSINTVRVIALQDHEGVHVIAAPMRFGHHGITDNFSGGGMVCDVDIDTGRICTAAIDKTGIVYESHPHSGKPFIGFQVPHWDQVIDVATNAMRLQSDVNYIGWDVAIQPDGACIVEGNSETGLALLQAPYAPSGSGRKHLVEPFLDS